MQKDKLADFLYCFKTKNIDRKLFIADIGTYIQTLVSKKLGRRYGLGAAEPLGGFIGRLRVLCALLTTRAARMKD